MGSHMGGQISRRSRDWRSWAPALGVLLLLAGLGWINRPSAENGYRGGFIIHSDDSARPTPRPAASDEPLGTPAPAPLSDDYEFMATQPDGETPVTYDPCREIHVVINGRTVPDGAERVVHESLEEMTAITGFQFVIDGEVTEVPVAQRAPYQPDLYGDRWAPVLIAWSDPDELPELEDVAGIGGSAPVQVGSNGSEAYVSGIVALNGWSFNQFMSYPNGSELARAVVLHELGHVLGLDHVDDPTQLMYHDNLGVMTHQAGDRAGLVRLSEGACIPDL